MSDFKDAIDFIFHSRESTLGNIKIGGHELWGMAGTHLALSGVAIGVACLIAIPIGLWLGHIGRGEFVAISVSNVGRAIPTLALLAFFIAYLGNGVLNVVVVLMLLAIPPILTNTYVGVRQADRGAVDAARGMGMRERDVVLKVELPIALPLMLGGLRAATLQVIATATIAAYVSLDGLGRFVIDGQKFGDAEGYAEMAGGAILVAALAISVELVLAGVQRLVVSPGLRTPKISRRAERVRENLTLEASS